MALLSSSSVVLIVLGTVLAVGSNVASETRSVLNKRQSDSLCVDSEALPPQCRHLLVNESILSTSPDMCNETCGDSLYTYYRKCDAKGGSSNAAMLDLACTKNGDGERCLEVFADESELQVCSTANPDNCPADCRRALGSTRVDCCWYTFFALFHTVD